MSVKTTVATSKPALVEFGEEDVRFMKELGVWSDYYRARRVSQMNAGLVEAIGRIKVFRRIHGVGVTKPQMGCLCSNRPPAKVLSLSGHPAPSYFRAIMLAKEKEWYDEFYRQEQTQFAPWYRFAIPHLRSQLTSETRLVDLGCGQGHLLRHLAREKFVSEERLFGLDQSATAVDFVTKWLPGAHAQVGDIYQLPYPKESFQVCFFMETIEHLSDPAPALQGIYSIIEPGGLLYLSFPNFLHLPWLAVRLLSDLLNKPNWIVRQPVDIIYTVPQVIRIVKKAGFELECGIGSNYGPPVFYPLEKEWVTKGLNALGLWWFSFHPILVFRKPAAAKRA